jgi:hypothetical protein
MMYAVEIFQCGAWTPLLRKTVPVEPDEWPVLRDAATGEGVAIRLREPCGLVVREHHPRPSP